MSALTYMFRYKNTLPKEEKQGFFKRLAELLAVITGK